MTSGRGAPQAVAGQQRTRTFDVLFVCTGNICRSAFAEVLARQLLVDRAGRAVLNGFHFSSAGVRATAGTPMHPYTRDALTAWGQPLYRAAGDFAARRLSVPMIDAADLILTAEESQRQAVAWVSSDAVPKMYGMRRFAQIIAAAGREQLPPDPTGRAFRLLELAPGLQATLPPPPPGEESIADPMGGTSRDHLVATDLIFDVVAAFVDFVAPLPRR